MLILALQAGVSLVTLHNTAFQDEGLYLYAGRQIIHHWNGGPIPPENYVYYFSGYPYAYPVVGGFLAMIGGLELARDFSLVCLLGVTTIVYSVTRKIFHHLAGLFAAAAYASAGMVLFVGRLATYDAPCLFLIALATAISVHCAMSRSAWISLAVGPLLVSAILTKYAALLFVPPVLGLLACLSVAFTGWLRGSWRTVLAVGSFAASLVVAYKSIDKSALHALSASTTNRVVGITTPRHALFLEVLRMGGVVFLIAFLGLLLAFRLQPRYRMAAVLLFGSAWLAPVYHIYKQEPISLDKHIAYGLFFAAPLAGYALAWLSGYGRKSFLIPHQGYWLAGLTVVLAMFTVGLGQSSAVYAWPNTSDLSTVMHTQLRDGGGMIMAEDVEVSRFDAMDVTEPWQWNSFYYPIYITPKHQFLFGRPAMVAAIKARYYNWIELSFKALPEQAYFLAGQMMLTRNYDLITIVPVSNSWGQTHFYLFRRAPVPGHGNFKSLAQLKMKHRGS